MYIISLITQSMLEAALLLQEEILISKPFELTRSYQVIPVEQYETFVLLYITQQINYGVGTNESKLKN